VLAAMVRLVFNVRVRSITEGVYMAEEKKEVAVAEAAGKLTFQQRGIDLPNEVTLTTADIKKYLAPKASDTDLYLFVQIARSQGLNPFAREIYFIPYGDKSSIVVGYEVYLKRVLASGLCEGFKVEMRNEGEANEQAVYIGYRKGWKEPFEWAVKTSTYNKKQGVWNVNPIHMIKKIAVSQGMRWQFADAIAGIPYTPEEVQVYGEEVAASFTTTDDKPVKETGSISLEDLKPGEPEVPHTEIRDVPGLVEKLKADLECEDVEPETAVPWDKIKKIPLANLTEQNVLDVVNMLNYPLTGADPKGIRKMLPKYLKAAIEKLEAWEKEGAK
jgi:phage recombination protein Bet